MGDLHLKRHWDPSGTWLTVEHADPEIEISSQLLYEMHEVPHLLDGALLACTDSDRHPVGDVLTIHARNRTVVYEVTGLDVVQPGHAVWRARWPG